jgi:hypothetical protein
MTLSIVESFQRAGERLRSPAGLQVLALACCLQFVNSVVAQTNASILLADVEAGDASLPETIVETLRESTGPLVLDLSRGVVTALALAVLVGLGVFLVLASRAFAGEEPTGVVDAARDGIAVASLRTLAAGALFLLSVTAGLFALVVPGVVLLVHLCLFPVVVATEDVGAIAALRRSWRLVSRDRLRVAAVLFGVVGVFFVVATLAGVVAGLLGGADTLPGALAVVAGNALYVTVAVAVLARTHAALTDVDTESSGPDLTAQPPFDDDEDWS